MLLAQKNDDVFNRILSLDVVHNSSVEALKVLNVERRQLTERPKAQKAEGSVLSGTISDDEMLNLRPRMIEVNSLINDLRAGSKKNCEESLDALESLANLLREKLQLTYKLESKYQRPKAA